MPGTSPNPLLDAFNDAMASAIDIEEAHLGLLTRYGFAIPNDAALDAIARYALHGLIEVGAGTGYWAHLLAERGVDVTAFDIDPAPSPSNQWFAGVQPWHPVHAGDHTVVDDHPGRTLLIVWPTRNEIWAADAVERYWVAGGTQVAYVGEGPGGSTGDDAFHARLGDLRVCAQCEYGIATSPCICGVEARWRRTASVELPHWPGQRDDLHIYDRLARSRKGRWSPRPRGRA